MVDEKRIRPVGDITWMGSVIWVLFSAALILLVGWKARQPAHKKGVLLVLNKGSLPEQVSEEYQAGTG